MKFTRTQYGDYIITNKDGKVLGRINKWSDTARCKYEVENLNGGRVLSVNGNYDVFNLANAKSVARQQLKRV